MLVEHYVKALPETSDHVIVLDQGTVLTESSPGEVQAHPAVQHAYLPVRRR